MLQILIRRDKDLKPPLGLAQQVAVLKIRPPQFKRRGDFVWRESVTQPMPDIPRRSMARRTRKVKCLLRFVGICRLPLNEAVTDSNAEVSGHLILSVAGHLDSLTNGETARNGARVCDIC